VHKHMCSGLLERILSNTGDAYNRNFADMKRRHHRYVSACCYVGQTLTLTVCKGRTLIESGCIASDVRISVFLK